MHCPWRCRLVRLSIRSLVARTRNLSWSDMIHTPKGEPLGSGTRSHQGVCLDQDWQAQRTRMRKRSSPSVATHCPYSWRNSQCHRCPTHFRYENSHLKMPPSITMTSQSPPFGARSSHRGRLRADGGDDDHRRCGLRPATMGLSRQLADLRRVPLQTQAVVLVEATTGEVCIHGFS